MDSNTEVHIRDTVPSLGKMPIVVFTLGKTGSSSIVEAISSAGFLVRQAHVLGESHLIQNLKRALYLSQSRAELDSIMEHVHAGVVTTRRLWLAQRAVASGEGHEKIKIVSMIRDPLDWYTSEMIEEYKHYRPGVIKWSRAVEKEQVVRDDGEVVRRLQASVSAAICGIDSGIDDPKYVEELRKFLPGKNPDSAIVRTHASRLARPLIWHKEYFEPVVGIDIFESRDELRSGWAIAENDFAQVLFIRYENLEDSTAALAKFLEIDEISLPRKNVSGGKFKAGDIKEAILTGSSEGLLEKLGRTEYCQAFGYRQE